MEKGWREGKRLVRGVGRSSSPGALKQFWGGSREQVRQTVEPTAKKMIRGRERERRRKTIDLGVKFMELGESSEYFPFQKLKRSVIFANNYRVHLYKQNMYEGKEESRA